MMTLGKMRRWAHTVALVLLVASARLPHAGQDDLACIPISGADAHGAAGLVDGAGGTSQPDHCAICHWTRLLRSPLAIAGVSIASPAPATLISRGALPAHGDVVHERLSARAPPVGLL